MKESVESIIQWHRETFPDATLDGQIKKLRTELEEFYASRTDDDDFDVSELADIFIVLCGIARFSMKEFIGSWNELYEARSLSQISARRLENAVIKKMAINRQRKWDKKDGQYQHKEV